MDAAMGIGEVGRRMLVELGSIIPVDHVKVAGNHNATDKTNTSLDGLQSHSIYVCTGHYPH